MGMLRVLSIRGDDEHPWTDKASTAKAEKIFNDLISKGHAAFNKKPDGHEKIAKFDPNAEEIIMVRPLVGG